MGPQNLRTTGDRIERLLDDLRAAADPRTYALAEELARVVTELYGAALERVVELVAEADPALLDRLADDELVASLLLVHGLHPEGLVTRVEGALASVRPYLAQHGGDVELLEVDEDVGAVHLRLLGSCDGCPSSAATLQGAVEAAINAVAPEIVCIDVDAAEPAPVQTPVRLTVKPEFDSCPAELGVA